MRWGRSGWWPAIGPSVGLALGIVDSVVNHVPVFLGEVGTARADRGGWSQASEFASLILDAGWAWAAAAVLAGWLTSRAAHTVRPGWAMARGALAGSLALLFATIGYYRTDVLFDGGAWWGRTIQFWVIASVLLGPLLGMAGAVIRRRGPVGTSAALLVPVGAALQMVLLPPPADSRMAHPVQLTIWIGAALSILGCLAMPASPPIAKS